MCRVHGVSAYREQPQTGVLQWGTGHSGAEQGGRRVMIVVWRLGRQGAARGE